MITSRTPFQTQFVVTVIGGSAGPLAVNMKHFLPEAAVARSFVQNGYEIRVASFATDEQDVLDGKSLLTVEAKWSDATARFPLSRDVFCGSSAVDVVLSLSLENASAAQILYLQPSNALSAGKTASMLLSLTSF